MGVNLPDVRRVVQYRLPKGGEPTVGWQRGGRTDRDGQDGEIIILIDDWVEGPRKEPQSIPKGRKSDDQSSQVSPLLDDSDEDILAEEQNKTRPSLPERRSKIPDFFYLLSNVPTCIRNRFLDLFEEPEEFRIHIRKDRCCSNCNPDFRLGKLDKRVTSGPPASLSDVQSELLWIPQEIKDGKHPYLYGRARAASAH